MHADRAPFDDSLVEQPLDPPAPPEPARGVGLGLGLAAVQALVSLGAIPAGVGMVIDPTGGKLGMTVELLARSPFHDFFVPGLFLLGINGLGSLVGSAASALRARWAGELAIALGLFLVVWMVVQMMWTLVQSPLQPVLLWVGLIEMGLGMALRDVRRH